MYLSWIHLACVNFSTSSPCHTLGVQTPLLAGGLPCGRPHQMPPVTCHLSPGWSQAPIPLSPDSRHVRFSQERSCSSLAGLWFLQFGNCAGRRGWRVETRGQVGFTCWLTTLISRGGVILKLPHFSWGERTKYRSIISTRTNSCRKKSHPWSILRILINKLRVETRGRGRFEHLFISSVGRCRAFLHRHYYPGSSA